MSVLLCLPQLPFTPTPFSLSAPPPVFLCLETSSVSSAALFFTSISVWLPLIQSHILAAARLPGCKLCFPLARFSLGLNVIANVPEWPLQLCVRVCVCL